MKENPLEQQKSKIDALKDEAKKQLGDIFDKNISSPDNGVSKIIEMLNLYQKHGLEFNKEEIVKEIGLCAEIKDRETFILKMLKAMKPVVILLATQGKIIEKVKRESLIEDAEKKGRIRLSEVMYCGVDKEKGLVHIHLSPSRDFITKDKIKDFNEEINKGLEKLAEIIKSDESIKKVTATSWIVAKSPERLMNLGFTIMGDISKEEKEKHFKNENRPIHTAFISREDFLKKYGKENLV